MDTHTTVMAQRHLDAGNDENVVTITMSRSEAWEVANGSWFIVDKQRLIDFLCND